MPMFVDGVDEEGTGDDDMDDVSAIQYREPLPALLRILLSTGILPHAVTLIPLCTLMLLALPSRQ